ncbi:fibronectin type III domain-containing protein [Shewanella woodyi]|uniref:Fibronectin type III domain protein n=1 Tax=Shewanella woodyi (strain ATCC 51908 / MS32) TaxID=392500 RepID=B1KJL8_SHEWM|nr:fibronectin type III domain-containing protein [Shewanella woodyi]ACA85691.1 Fibronectin type III domain protein [Shewanella woodyi ATCC 51908]
MRDMFTRNRWQRAVVSKLSILIGRWIELRGAALVSSILLLFFCGGANAAGGIGSVWATASDDSSISITWSVPSGDYDHVGSNYKVCYRKTPTVNVCGVGPYYEASNSYHATGLSSGTEYKFKVWCYCKKRNWRGKWKDAKWRKIGTYKQSTSPEPEPDVLVSSISVVDVAPGASKFEASIDVEVTYTNPAAFEFVRVCYKKLGNMSSMNSICSKRDQPPISWTSSDHGRGWLDIAPAPSGTIFSFGSLKQCRQYKVVSYAFYDGVDTGLKLGETNVHTPGDCKANKMAVVIVDDYSETILHEYAQMMSHYYDEHLFQHLAMQYDQELFTAQKLMMEEQRVDIVQPKALIEYLVSSDSQVWDRWQQERSLVEQRLTLDAYMQDKYPELYSDILDDLKEPEQQREKR